MPGAIDGGASRRGAARPAATNSTVAGGSRTKCERLEVAGQRFERPARLACEVRTGLLGPTGADDLLKLGAKPGVIVRERHLDAAVGHRHQRHAIGRATRRRRKRSTASRNGVSRPGRKKSSAMTRAKARPASVMPCSRPKGAGSMARSTGAASTGGRGLDHLQREHLPRAPSHPQRDVLRLEIGDRRAVPRHDGEVHVQQIQTALACLLRSRCGQLPLPPTGDSQERTHVENRLLLKPRQSVKLGVL